MRSMVTILLVLISTQAYASDKVKVMYATCGCQVINGDGVAVNRLDLLDVIPTMPFSTSSAMVTGSSANFSEIENLNCKESQKNELTQDCDVQKDNALLRAMKQCHETATYIGGAGSQGIIDMGSCFFSLHLENIE